MCEQNMCTMSAYQLRLQYSENVPLSLYHNSFPAPAFFHISHNYILWLCILISLIYSTCLRAGFALHCAQRFIHHCCLLAEKYKHTQAIGRWQYMFKCRRVKCGMPTHARNIVMNNCQLNTLIKLQIALV